MSTSKQIQKRMGTDPLSWIQDSRQTAPLPESSKQSKHSKPALPSKQEQLSKQGKPQSTRAGLQPGWNRATFIIRETHGEGIKSLAYWERRDIKDIVDEALAAFLKTKSIRPIPRKSAD